MKKFIALSAIAALSTGAFAAEDLSAKIADLESQLKALNAKVNEVKAHDANDNLKFNVDFRTAIDNIEYKNAAGQKIGENNDLMTNRLWLNMGYAVDQNNIFKGTLSYNKAYGDSANHSQANTNPGYAAFDWVTNENATDNTLKVKEAYWLYMNDTFLGTNVPWTASVGRRPSTDGLGINLRENAEAKSPLSHIVNVEFDGASFKFDDILPTPGDSFKICLGRGLTNATPRFNGDYAVATNDPNNTSDTDMYGFIFVPYDNGQYSLWTNVARADNIIGFSDAYTYYLMTHNNNPTGYTGTDDGFVDVGSLNLYSALFKAEGIGNGISKTLDDTKAFVSWSMSETDPNGNHGGMLGTTDSKTGHSIWVGINIPCPLTEDGRIGVEWNKGSKYWRPVTYAEDTMIGSKVAARGTAWEVYYNKPLTKALQANLRYTKITYDYTGSNAFFGYDGTPMDINSANAASSVAEAQDIRLAISYRF